MWKRECHGLSQLRRLLLETQCGIMGIVGSTTETASSKTGCFSSTAHVIRITLWVLTGNSRASDVLCIHRTVRLYVKSLLNHSHSAEMEEILVLSPLECFLSLALANSEISYTLCATVLPKFCPPKHNTMIDH